MDSKTVLLELPYPPTVNTYWRSIGRGRVIISAKGRDYRNAICEYVIAENTCHHAGRLRIVIRAFMPDRRQRDLDNIPKAVLDALESAGVFENDNQIDDLRIIRMGVEPPGRIEVEITESEGGWDELGDST